MSKPDLIVTALMSGKKTIAPGESFTIAVPVETQPNLADSQRFQMQGSLELDCRWDGRELVIGIRHE